MARSIWNGTITFGMVAVPIKLYSATESKTVSFRQVHLKDGCRIRQRRICPADEQEVPSDEVVKGYDTGGERYVVLDPEEIKAAAGDRGKVVHLTEFVRAGEIDPVLFEKSYYVGSRDDADAYRLLHTALKRSERVGVGRFTFHNREYLAAVRALDDTIALHTMRFHDELVETDEIRPEEPERTPSSREVKMATQLVEALDAPFEPESYDDTYREAVMDLIERKAAGGEVDEAPPEAEPQSDDLLAALEASLSAPRDAKKTKAKAKKRKAAAQPTKAKSSKAGR